MENLIFNNENEWHLLRKQGIGGSDAAAVLGLSKWKTPYQLYYEKTSDEIFSIENESLHWGKILEPIIRQEYSERTGRVILQPDGVLRHPQYQFMQANLDGYTEDERILEIKTARSGSDWGEPGTDEVPTEYLLQVQHYLAVTGLKIADVAVLIGGSDFRIYEIKADNELHNLLIEKEAEFWQRVTENNPPELKTEDDFLLAFAGKEGTIIADEFTLEKIRKLKEIRQMKMDIELDESAVKLELMALLMDNDTISDDSGKQLITWKKPKETIRLDAEKLKKEKPEIFEEFKKIIPSSRRFLVK